ncbi:flavin reductase [Agrobacterium vitis]|nr:MULTISPECIES: flavin reductase family protein [Rhizobium/Agrobacterium group]MCF1464399.1 flavin reductase [Allorhizobium ampelinum]MCF1495340.1 flavin reductase [Allorhizobium ampelinum]MUZ54205.1 flavin reductase [Agrobacterium vitis]MUZ93888.1 flavin reductase [Agrobacterium vitis]MVA41970.1 flavin reductase [Agrobacterium vitis]
MFKQGMRRLAAGVSIITTFEDGQPHGFAATSVTSVSADPAPLLLVCVSKTVSCHDTIMRAGKFCVNVLRETDIETARLFSSAEFRQRRFALCDWQTLSTGAPVLTSALANFDCRVHHAMEVQTHTVFFGLVDEIKLLGEDVHPLLYVNGQFDGLRSVVPTVAAGS